MPHLGPVLPIMLLLSTITGLVMMLRTAPVKTDLTVWVFSDPHAASFREPAAQQPPLIELHRRRTGKSVNVQQMSYRALEIRLLSMMLSPESADEVPDVVAIEIMSVGKFFRAAVDSVGLLPLNDYLAAGGWDKRLLHSRFAPYSKGGVIFGVPHDVHPVGIAYRKDFFDEAGIDLAAAGTWKEFHQLCLAAQESWRRQGHNDRWAMELTNIGAEWMLVMMMQRGINPLDQANRVYLDDPRVAEVVAFYAQMFAGPQRIGAAPSPGQQGYRDLTDGRVAAWFCPDFRPAYVKKYAPQLHGKLRLMPLPRFDPSDAPTGTWGGTMFGIPRNCRDPHAAWKLIESLLLTDEAFAARQLYSSVLPPDVRHWDDPTYQESDDFFGGQRLMKLYTDLARQLPARYVTPFTPLASTELTDVLGDAIAAVEAGADDNELEALCRAKLAQRDADLKRRVEFGMFD